MIPKYCPQCGKSNIKYKFDFINYEISTCENCKLEFQVDSIDDLYCGPISGPCTYCGDPKHWKPDCPILYLDLINIRNERQAEGLPVL